MNCTDVWNCKDYVCLDIETTGLSPSTCQIIEFAAVRVRNNRVVDQYSELICPQCSISPTITKLTGISNAMVRDKRTISEAILDIYNFIGDDVILGHNVKFDLSFIKKAIVEELGVILENPIMDTMYLARSLLRNISNVKLGTLSCYLDEPFNGNHHRALADAEVTHRIYQKLCFIKNNQ